MDFSGLSDDFIDENVISQFLFTPEDEVLPQLDEDDILPVINEFNLMYKICVNKYFILGLPLVPNWRQNNPDENNKIGKSGKTKIEYNY